MRGRGICGRCSRDGGRNETRSWRQKGGDWAGNALNDLVGTRQRIEVYGIGEFFFADSIKKLAELKGVEAPELR